MKFTSEKGDIMLAVKNFFMPERKAPETPKFSRMPEAFLRSIRRRSLRIKRTKSLIVPDTTEKRKSGNHLFSDLHVMYIYS